ncbi:hypothetical protein ABPG72_008241 [Tetrahymena utriculariae]
MHGNFQNKQQKLRLKNISKIKTIKINKSQYEQGILKNKSVSSQEKELLEENSNLFEDDLDDIFVFQSLKESNNKQNHQNQSNNEDLMNYEQEENGDSVDFERQQNSQIAEQTINAEEKLKPILNKDREEEQLRELINFNENIFLIMKKENIVSKINEFYSDLLKYHQEDIFVLLQQHPKYDNFEVLSYDSESFKLKCQKDGCDSRSLLIKKFSCFQKVQEEEKFINQRANMTNNLIFTEIILLEKCQYLLIDFKYFKLSREIYFYPTIEDLILSFDPQFKLQIFKILIEISYELFNNYNIRIANISPSRIFIQGIFKNIQNIKVLNVIIQKIDSESYEKQYLQLMHSDGYNEFYDRRNATNLNTLIQQFFQGLMDNSQQDISKLHFDVIEHLDSLIYIYSNNKLKIYGYNKIKKCIHYKNIELIRYQNQVGSLKVGLSKYIMLTTDILKFNINSNYEFLNQSWNLSPKLVEEFELHYQAFESFFQMKSLKKIDNQRSFLLELKSLLSICLDHNLNNEISIDLCKIIQLFGNKTLNDWSKCIFGYISYSNKLQKLKNPPPRSCKLLRVGLCIHTNGSVSLTFSLEKAFICFDRQHINFLITILSMLKKNKYEADDIFIFDDEKVQSSSCLDDLFDEDIIQQNESRNSNQDEINQENSLVNQTSQEQEEVEFQIEDKFWEDLFPVDMKTVEEEDKQNISPSQIIFQEEQSRKLNYFKENIQIVMKKDNLIAKIKEFYSDMLKYHQEDIFILLQQHPKYDNFEILAYDSDYFKLKCKKDNDSRALIMKKYDSFKRIQEEESFINKRANMTNNLIFTEIILQDRYIYLLVEFKYFKPARNIHLFPTIQQLILNSKPQFKLQIFKLLIEISYELFTQYNIKITNINPSKIIVQKNFESIQNKQTFNIIIQQVSSEQFDLKYQELIKTDQYNGCYQDNSAKLNIFIDQFLKSLSTNSNQEVNQLYLDAVQHVNLLNQAYMNDSLKIYGYNKLHKNFYGKNIEFIKYQQQVSSLEIRLDDYIEIITDIFQQDLVSKQLLLENEFSLPIELQEEFSKYFQNFERYFEKKELIKSEQQNNNELSIILELKNMFNICFDRNLVNEVDFNIGIINKNSQNFVKKIGSCVSLDTELYQLLKNVSKILQEEGEDKDDIFSQDQFSEEIKPIEKEKQNVSPSHIKGEEQSSNNLDNLFDDDNQFDCKSSNCNQDEISEQNFQDNQIQKHQEEGEEKQKQNASPSHIKGEEQLLRKLINLNENVFIILKKDNLIAKIKEFYSDILNYHQEEIFILLQQLPKYDNFEVIEFDSDYFQLKCTKVVTQEHQQ